MLSRLALLAACQTPMFRAPDLDHAFRQIKIHVLSQRGPSSEVSVTKQRADSRRRDSTQSRTSVMVEIWAGDAQTVPEAHLGSAGASPIAPGAQIASRRATPSRLRRSSSPTQMPPASARTASSTSSTSCLRPVVPRDCYRTRPEAGQRKAGAIFRGGGLAAARALDRLFAETHDPDQAGARNIGV